MRLLRSAAAVAFVAGSYAVGYAQALPPEPDPLASVVVPLRPEALAEPEPEPDTTTSTTSPPETVPPPAETTTTTSTTTPPPAETTTTRPTPRTTAPAPQARTVAPNACQAAIMRNRAPLAPGASERCSSPVWNWGATSSAGTIYYNAAKIARSGGSDSLWDYVVAHERAHARRAVAGDPTWANEYQADRDAARYYPEATNRWSPRR